MNVLHQRGDALIQQWKVSPRVLMIVAVVIPEPERDGDDTCSSLDQSSRDKKLFRQHWRRVAVWLGIAPAVLFNDSLVLALIVERLEQLAGCQHSERLLVERINAFHQAAGIDVTTEAVESRQQRSSIGEAIERDA